MRSYLSLIPIAAKVRRRQNRMTILCIVFAVFLVTAVFGMAEMGIRMEQARLAQKHGALTFQEIAGSQMGQALLGPAAAAFVLILLAGVLMISSSISSSVAQRTKFFGMMRCIGMSRQQIIRFVRLEALNWCRIGVPVGLALGIVSTWALCWILRFLVGGEFSEIPLFGISLSGIVSGTAVGIITVLIAAGAPARRAAKVSPAAAVSGSAESGQRVRRAADLHTARIETALGIRHAVSAKKNLVLMTGSFALSIVLFLCFSVLIEFVNYLMPQSAAAPDLTLSSSDGGNSINAGLTETLRSMDGVKEIFGRRSLLGIPADVTGAAGDGDTVDLVSYDAFDLECLKKDGALKKGSDLSKVCKDSSYVLAAWDPDSSWEIGDKITVEGEELEIAGLLNYDPFSSDGLTHGKLTLIMSGETFVRLTGIADYSLVLIQTVRNATEEQVEAIRRAAGDGLEFQDLREQRTTGTYTAFVGCVYGFLAIITLVAVLNIVNSISMSVTARIRQYGAMRAVGMDGYQVTKMIAAEAFTYAFCGCAVGCAAGVPLDRLLYQVLITRHFPYAVWSLPAASLAVILLFVILVAAAAVYMPAKRIRELSVTETISEL